MSRLSWAVCATAAVLVTASVAHAADKAAAPKPELAKAVASQNDAKIQKLLAAGAALDLVDSKGQTALLYAAQQGNAALIQQLVEKGAAVDFRGDDGATPLGVALRNPATTPEIVQILLAKGAKADIPDKTGRTPLMQAVLRSPLILDFEGQATIIRALLAAGADPSRRDDAGFSALHYAAQMGEPRQQLQLLLAAAPDANATSSKGANVLMMAAMGDQRPTADYLIAKGFRPVAVAARVETEIRDPLTHDLAPRANALGQDWYAQYAARTGDAAAAQAALAAAAPAYDAAIVEARRATAAYETALAKHTQSRREAQAAVAIANVASALLTAGAGSTYQYVYTLQLQATVEADQRAIAGLKSQTAEMEARVAEIRARHLTK